MRILSDIELTRVAGAEGPIITVGGQRPLGSNFESPGGDYSPYTMDDSSMEANTSGTKPVDQKSVEVLKLAACALNFSKTKSAPTVTNAAGTAIVCSEAVAGIFTKENLFLVLDNVHYPMAGHVD